MARFTVRVMLLNLNIEANIYEDILLESVGGGIYDRLHDKMRNEDFVKQIRDDTNFTVYNLPNAEYNFSTNELDIDQVTQRVTRIVSDTISEEKNMSFRILVTQSLGRRWVNLEESDKLNNDVIDYAHFLNVEAEEIIGRIEKIIDKRNEL